MEPETQAHVTRAAAGQPPQRQDLLASHLGCYRKLRIFEFIPLLKSLPIEFGASGPGEQRVSLVGKVPVFLFFA